ncbi:putative pre-mRNA-splicing factor ATP-dependent RNA helicase [Prunus yedoensis var. nudiflora]|uniref:RNA helicase n=1 Tax=Prunus yedoensis var. nudiflora TaxID=2094558 RepID=A0A314UQA8_PRUYE|nr:putative pre-mRNA-splicing factor ATP-dependent RNA helicase [Prunus yedoensis var. nudiflora]
MLRVITFGLLKQLVQRDGLRLVIKCANGDVDEVSSYLKDFKGRNICRIMAEISYEVEIIYLKKRHNCISAASYIVMKIHLAEDEGDILLFLAGEDDIDVAFHSISKKIEVSSDDMRQLTIVRIYNGCLPREMQSLGFDTRGRRVVLATDSSLASITIPSA